jgi:multiple sugar transport system ATP-binding protein
MRLTFDNCSKRFFTLRGVVHALEALNLTIEDGEFFVLLGPSGCGKSTLLNLAAGLEKPTSGEIRFGDKRVAAPQQRIFLTPRDRNVAMVFQSYALYPHMSVYDNIAFPLKISKAPKAKIGQEVQHVAGLLGIVNLLDRKPGELSGGQRQRVAIARALVRRPEVFLLDEPLSNLDIQLRTSTRTELKRIQKDLRITTLYVTHDQIEAMTLGDRIALLRQGQLVQVGTPDDLYERPQTPFAATFVGSPPMNLIPATWEERDGQTRLTFCQAFCQVRPDTAAQLRHIGSREVLLGIRPEHVYFAPDHEAQTIAGAIHAIEPLGRETLFHVRADALDLLVLSDERPYALGEAVQVRFDVGRLHVFKRQEEA